MKKWIIVCAAVLMAVNVASAGSGQACVACHGQTGVSTNPEWPNLAGQNTAYLADQIRAFRDGTRSNPAMAPFVSGLSEADIVDLATHFSGQKPAAAANGDPTLVERGENLSAYCKACHGMQGRPATGVWPVIAGQHAAYLQKQLTAFKDGKRVNGHMAAAISALGEAEFAALAAYYSQLDPGVGK